MAADPTKQLAEKKAKKSQLAVGAPEPQPAPERGWGWFGDFVGDLKDAVTNPVATAKQMPGEFRRTFIDPIYGLGESVNPFVDQSPMERVNKAAGGLLTAADLLTPAIPEGAFATRASRQLASRMADAANSGRKYRGVLGVHGSPVKGLREIQPTLGSEMNPDEKVAWFWDAATGGFNSADLMQRAKAYAGEPGEGGEIYLARFPRNAVRDESVMKNHPVTYPNQASSPGRVVGSVEITPEMFERVGEYSPVLTMMRPDAYKPVSEALRQRMIASMTPSERRVMLQAQQLPDAVTAEMLADEFAQLKARYEATSRTAGR